MKTYIIIAILFIVKFNFSQDINSPAPDFSGKDMNNNSVKLSDLKGKVILLDFWASWCLPCKKSLPYLINYYINNKDTNLVILAVNVDTDPANFKKFRDKLDSDFPFTVVLDGDNKIVSKYNNESIPTTIFIDKKGIINKVSVGFTDDSKQEYTDELAKLLKE